MTDEGYVKLSVERRIEECEKVIAKYPTYFEQTLPTSGRNGSMVANKVSSKLEIMGTYILAGDEQSRRESNILTDYKEKRNITSEIPFSVIDDAN